MKYLQKTENDLAKNQLLATDKSFFLRLDFIAITFGTLLMPIYFLFVFWRGGGVEWKGSFYYSS